MPATIDRPKTTDAADLETDIAVAQSRAAQRAGTAGSDRIIGGYRSKHVFRSEREGLHRGQSYTMDAKKESWIDPDDDPVARRIARVSLQRWEKRYAEDEQAALAQAVEENGGSRKVRFKYIGRRDGHTGHVEYETNSDAIAAVLNMAIRRGELQQIVYLDQSKYLKVGDKKFAITDEGWELAQKEATATGTGIEIIAKD